MSSQPTGAATPAPAPEKEWHCPLCTSLNAPKLTRCSSCSYDIVAKQIVETPAYSASKASAPKVAAPDEGGPVDMRWVAGVVAVGLLVAVPGAILRSMQARHAATTISTVVKDVKERREETRIRMQDVKAAREKEAMEERRKFQMAEFQATAAGAATKTKP